LSHLGGTPSKKASWKAQRPKIKGQESEGKERKLIDFIRCQASFFLVKEQTVLF
jgi:hypothetical protein